MGLRSYGKSSTAGSDRAWQLLYRLAICTFPDTYGFKNHGPLGLAEVICLAYQKRRCNPINFGGNMHVPDSRGSFRNGRKRLKPRHASRFRASELRRSDDVTCPA